MIKPTQDNVLVVLEPDEENPDTMDKRRVWTPAHRGSRYSRIAKVLAVGPGHYGRTSYKHPEGIFHPTELKPGDRVIVDHLCGQDYKFDLNVPRHNKGAEFGDLLGDKGEFRIIREEEALAVVEPDNLPG